MQVGNLSLVRGDDIQVAITITAPNGTPYNLSGCSLVFQALQNGNYFSPPWLTVTTGPTGHISTISGLSQLTFAAAATSGLDDLNHFYTIRLYSALGTTTTLIDGLFSLQPS